jgi:hypothetical protein
MSHLLLSVMGAFAQFERDLIRERQREGSRWRSCGKGHIPDGSPPLPLRRRKSCGAVLLLANPRRRSPVSLASAGRPYIGMLQEHGSEG